jgi:actin-related protein
MVFPPASISVLAWKIGVILTGPAEVGKVWVALSEWADERRAKIRHVRRRVSFIFSSSNCVGA